MGKANWSRKLTRSFQIRATGEHLRTLSDARAYVLAIKDGRANRSAWQAAAGKLIEAAEGGDIKAATNAMHLALLIENRMVLD
jgi:hypothetical protein